MLIHIDVRSGVPAYKQIMDQVEHYVLTGQTEPGMQIPTVRELAQQLNLNPMTVSKAYSLLERDGLLERRKGVGLFVRDLDPTDRVQESLKVLEDAMRKVALLAAQLKVPEEEALRIFRDLYGQFSQQEGDET